MRGWVWKMILMGSLVAGCGGGGGSKYKIPPGALGYVTQDQLDQLAALGFPINQGLTPPDVQGTYYADSVVRLASNVPNDTANTFANESISLSGQASDNTVSLSYVQGPESGDGLGSFVSGEGTAFTIYTQISGLYSGIPFKDAMLTSGELAADGIHEFREALLLTQKAPDPNNVVLLVGQARVVAESDGLAARLAALSALTAPAQAAHGEQPQPRGVAGAP
jgi:hypothetical protein